VSGVQVVAPRLLLVGAASIIVGAFGPWEVIEFHTGGDLVVTGLGNRGGLFAPGALTLLFGLALVALGLTRLGSISTAGWSTGLAGFTVLLALWKIRAANSDGLGTSSSVGWGLILTFLGAALALGASIAALVDRVDADAA
jgi:hypothetical protein